ncbi:MAG TPA: DUF2795 domain-containing protein [Opitutales bacterium]|nr:DUF2795 domain-containing protein [Opitutales bacterium]
MANELERGDIFFFYRPKVGAESAREVQRLYIVLANSSVYRLLIVGANKLPAQVDRSDPAARRWALVREVCTDCGTIESILQGGKYRTKTRGTRELAPAAPVGEGRYSIVHSDDISHLVFRLQRPKDGELADKLGLRREASFVIAVRNPEVSVEGFPEAEPDYPEQIHSLFKGRRWLPVSNSGLLNYENAQLVLISALNENAAEKLGIEFKKEANLHESVDLDLPDKTFSTIPEIQKTLSEEDGVDRYGCEVCGREFETRSAYRRHFETSHPERAVSAADLEHALVGVEYPNDRQSLMEKAKENGASEKILKTIEALPDRKFRDAADLATAFQESLKRS